MIEATNESRLVDRKVYSGNQKPWVQGSLDEPGSVSLGGKPVAVKGDGTFQGQAPSRTTTISAKGAAGNTTNENWQLNIGGGAAPDSTLSYTHDAEGNLLGDGTSAFEWDLKNRLTVIVTGTHRTEFTYDGADRRVRVVEKDSGTVTSDKRYVFHGLSLLEERAADNTTVLRRFYGGGHVDVADGGKRYAHTTDHLGSIREVLLLDGTTGNPTTATMTARYDYDLWGKRTVLDGGTAAETLTLHGYTGHVRHAWSGLWLAPYRAYSSSLGRWISRDPIGESGGINLLAYVGNGPGVKVDPLGWEPTVNLFADGSPDQKAAAHGIPTIPGVVSAAGHGGFGAPVIQGPSGEFLTPQKLASMLAPHLADSPGALIWLPSCYLGQDWSGEDSFAQPLADATGHDVWATAGPVYFLSPDRDPVVSMCLPDFWLPTKDPKYANYRYRPGWQTFKPKKPAEIPTRPRC